MTGPEDTSELLSAADRQAAEKDSLRRMLLDSRGTFSLSIAVCNSPALRDRLIREFSASQEGIRVVSIPKGTGDVLDLLAREVADEGLSALFLTGLEESVSSFADSHPVLRSLNASRELWKDRYRCPVVFWVPEYIARRLSTGARDFWAWKSHEFEFPLDAPPLFPTSVAEPSDAHSMAANLDANEKRLRVLGLKNRIAGVGEQPSPEMSAHLVAWSNELAYLQDVLGETDQAENTLREALEIAESLGWSEGEAAICSNFGSILKTRGDLERAEKLYRRSVEIYDRLGRDDMKASLYATIGTIYATRHELQDAERLYRKSLELAEGAKSPALASHAYARLGMLFLQKGNPLDARRMLEEAVEINRRTNRQDLLMTDYAAFAVLQSQLGELDEAEQLYCNALAIAERLGDRVTIADSHKGLGIIGLKRGDLDGAQQRFREALALSEQLGLLEGVADNCGELGIVHYQRGEFQQAREMWEEALDLYKRIGIRHMAQKVRGLLDGLPDAGTANASNANSRDL